MTREELSEIKEQHYQNTIGVLKNLIELHEILKLDGWEQDVVRIKEWISKLEKDKENES